MYLRLMYGVLIFNCEILLLLIVAEHRIYSFIFFGHTFNLLDKVVAACPQRQVAFRFLLYPLFQPKQYA